MTEAADYVGVHPQTLRAWADSGRVPPNRLDRERRYHRSDLDALTGNTPAVPERREALYLRVSGHTGQETSLKVQEAELRGTPTCPITLVARDRASGLNEKRPGLHRVPIAAGRGEYTVLRVTHEDRLARFGGSWIRLQLAQHGVTVEVPHPTPSVDARSGVLAAFTAGRLCGKRSREAKQRLHYEVSNGEE